MEAHFIGKRRSGFVAVWHLVGEVGLTRCGKRLRGLVDRRVQLEASERVCPTCQRYALAGKQKSWSRRG